MSNVLKINLEVLKKTEEELSNCSTRMEVLRQTLENAVSEIREGWKSEGGKKFLSKFDNEWLKHVNDYAIVIEHMASNLKLARDKYQPLIEEADNISFFNNKEEK